MIHSTEKGDTLPYDGNSKIWLAWVGFLEMGLWFPDIVCYSERRLCVYRGWRCCTFGGMMTGYDGEVGIDVIVTLVHGVFNEWTRWTSTVWAKYSSKDGFE